MLLYANAASCTQLEIGYSIMASIVPTLKTFMKPYDRQNDGAASYGYGTGNASHKLSSLASKSREEGGNGASERDPAEQELGTGRLGAKFMGKLRPEHSVYEARVVTRPENGAQDRKSAESENSRRMIIQKGVEWSVDYDARNPSLGPKEDDPYTIEEVDGRRPPQTRGV